MVNSLSPQGITGVWLFPPLTKDLGLYGKQ